MARLDVIVIETASLGDRSYIAHDGTVAVVIDPPRDIDRIDSESKPVSGSCVAFS
jgi:hydroxyacylglutathione hydrolase